MKSHLSLSPIGVLLRDYRNTLKLTEMQTNGRAKLDLAVQGPTS